MLYHFYVYMRHIRYLVETFRLPFPDYFHYYWCRTSVWQRVLFGFMILVIRLVLKMLWWIGNGNMMRTQQKDTCSVTRQEKIQQRIDIHLHVR